MHVVEMPCVGADRTMEPDRMVEAHHTRDVAFEMQWTSAETGPVRREPDERRMHVRATPTFYVNGVLQDISFGMQSLHDAVAAAVEIFSS